MGAFTGGQVYAALVARHSERAVPAVAQVMARGLAQLALAVLLALPVVAFGALARGRQDALRARVLLLGAAAAGKVAWFRKVPLYSVEEARRTTGD